MKHETAPGQPPATHTYRAFGGDVKMSDGHLLPTGVAPFEWGVSTMHADPTPGELSLASALIAHATGDPVLAKPFADQLARAVVWQLRGEWTISARSIRSALGRVSVQLHHDPHRMRTFVLQGASPAEVALVVGRALGTEAAISRQVFEQTYRDGSEKVRGYDGRRFLADLHRAGHGVTDTVLRRAVEDVVDCAAGR